MMELSLRLSSIEAMIDEGNILCDIGTDHGYLIAQAIIDEKVPFAYGIDINQEPLQSAQNTLEMNHIDPSKYQLILNNGLQDLKLDASTYVLAGLGTDTILMILKQYQFLNHHTLIVQSNTKWVELRRALNTLGFKIVAEDFVYDMNKPYYIVKCRIGQQTLTAHQMHVAVTQDLSDNVMHHAYLEQRRDYLEKICAYQPALKEEFDTLNLYLKERNNE